MKKYLILNTVIFLLVACQANDNQATDENVNKADYDTEPIGYKSEQDVKQKYNHDQLDADNDQLDENNLEGFVDNLEKPSEQQEDTYTDGFYNEQSQRIAETVNQLDEVKISQVWSNEEKVYVAVMLDQHYYDVNVEPMVEQIEQLVKPLAANKQIIVQTDAIHWNQMRDLDARESVEDTR